MISIFTDGSSSSKGGKPGGWGFVIVEWERDILRARPIFSGAGHNPDTTNNVMELTAAIRGLKAYEHLEPSKRDQLVELVSDSQYCLGLASGKFSPSTNLDLVVELRKAALRVNPRFRWVRGHDNDVWNEVADRLAKYGKKNGAL